MRIKDIILETVQDDHVINQTARAVANKLADESNWETAQVYGWRDPGAPDTRSMKEPQLLLGDANPDLKNSGNSLYNKLAAVRVAVLPVPGGQQAVMGRNKNNDLQIHLNYDRVSPYSDVDSDLNELRAWMTETLAHEIRHALDRLQREASTSQRPHDFGGEHYYQKQHIADEPDTTQSEVNAYFTQILHQVEDDLKRNNITDVNRALKFAQDSLETSQLADVVFGGWDNNNPVLRRLSSRMAQFVHSLYNN